LPGNVEEPFGFYARNPAEKDLVAAVPFYGELVSVGGIPCEQGNEQGISLILTIERRSGPH
jgi:hypothetical protein